MRSDCDSIMLRLIAQPYLKDVRIKNAWEEVNINFTEGILTDQST